MSNQVYLYKIGNNLTEFNQSFTFKSSTITIFKARKEKKNKQTVTSWIGTHHLV